VVAAGDDVDAGLEELVGLRRQQPAAAGEVSPLAITQSTSSFRQYSPMRLMMIDRPGLPTTSPIARIRTFIALLR